MASTTMIKLTGMAGTAGIILLTYPLAAAPQEFQSPAGITMSPSGQVVVADRGGHRIFVIDPDSRTMQVLAGVGTAGFAGDGGPAARAAFRNPEWVDYDSAGNLWVADRGNERVRVIDAAGIIQTRVGGTQNGYVGDDGPAAAAGLTRPFGLLVGPKDAVYVFDTEAHAIRRVDPADGRIATVVGNGTAGFEGDGGPGRRARTRRPHNGVFDAAGRLVFGDSFNHRIRRWDPARDLVETLAGTGEEGAPRVGGPARESAFGYFGAIVVERDGSIVFTSTVDNQIFRLRGEAQTIEVVAGTGEAGLSGDGGRAIDAQLRFPYGLAIDEAGNLYVADAGNRRVRRINRSSGTIETIAGG